MKNKEKGYSKHLQILCDDEYFMSSHIDITWNEKDQSNNEDLRICKLTTRPQIGGSTVVLRLEEVDELISKLQLIRERLAHGTGK